LSISSSLYYYLNSIENVLNSVENYKGDSYIINVTSIKSKSTRGRSAFGGKEATYEKGTEIIYKTQGKYCGGV